MKIKDIVIELHSGDSISANNIASMGPYPVFGGNGLRGYTDTYNSDGQYVIIGRQGAYCGNTRYYSGKSFLTEHAIFCNPKQEYNYVYLSELLSLIGLSKYQGQSAQPGLSVNTISNIDIECCSTENQHLIGSFISMIDNAICVKANINRNLPMVA
jgi:type I restriction enzyme S subunit